MKTARTIQKSSSRPEKKYKAPRVVIITGLSGSGKTVALRAAEDSDFYCVDNLPVSLMNSLIKKVSCRTGINNIAVGIDIREKDFLSEAGKLLKVLRSRYKVEILFLDADTDVLIRRFKETRRPHPLGGELLLLKLLMRCNTRGQRR